MNTSGEVADLMAKEAIQMTESAVKLTALGVKNLAAIVMALANDDGKTEGVAKLKQMLKTGKQLCICLLYTSPSPRDRSLSRMPSSA